jgi:hypothetical protein
MDLTDLPSVKAWLGLPSAAGPSDGLLAQLITAASAFIGDYLNRQLLSANYVETYDATGTRSLMLRQAPVTAVASVSFCGQAWTTPGDPVAGTPGFIFDGRRLSLIGGCFPSGALVTVSYTAGYAAVPPAVAQAAIELVGEAFRRRERIGQSSKSLGGQETAAFQVTDMNATNRQMLAAYRAVAPV